MRADRLVSLVLLLRRHGRLTATTLARELEVSTRTVLRDIEALSAAGVPVYAERGRHGGFVLSPGFRTELTGLNHDEALALLTAGSGRGEQVFGLGSALASAMRKVVDALPESHRASASDAAQRILVDPETDLLARRPVTEEAPDTAAMVEVRRAVLAGHKLRIHYAAPGQAPQWRTVDPIGLVTVRDRGYLLATRSGADRTYRLSRVLAAEELPETAQRPGRVDLDRIWRERSAQFLSDGDHITVLVLVVPARREELLDTALAVRAEEPDADGRLRLEVTFQDSRHAEWALWQLGTDAEALAPQSLRASLRERAAAMATRYQDSRRAARQPPSPASRGCHTRTMRGIHDPRDEEGWRHRRPERGCLTLFVWAAVARAVYIPTALLLDSAGVKDERLLVTGVAISAVVSALLVPVPLRLYFNRARRRHRLAGAARAYQQRQAHRQ